MLRLLPKLINPALLGAIPTLLLGGWLTGHWILGAAAALVPLCVLAIRSPQLRFTLGNPRLLKLLSSTSGKVAGERLQPAATPAPPRRKSAETANLSLAEQMIAQGRVALLLRPQIAASLPKVELQVAQAALDEAMAIVPLGSVIVRPRCFDVLDEESAQRAERLINVEGFFLDRFAVTNAQYLEFVEDGGYEQMSLWDESIWPAVLGFVDQSGEPGPHYWNGGAYPTGKENHPVVGVSWYEACAYARWAGKRLPTDAEWVKAGVWPVQAEGAKPVQRRFPWGDALDRKRVNVWGSGYDNTIAVDSVPEGASVNGVQQLVGNVWEWTSGAFGAWEPAGRRIETTMPLKSIRGGAFDTYFENQASCQFQSGESPLARKHNIGFRCALGFCDVAHTADGGDTDVIGEQPTMAHEEVLA
jgi:iron(II)-dependent oxidoreductase